MKGSGKLWLFENVKVSEEKNGYIIGTIKESKKLWIHVKVKVSKTLSIYEKVKVGNLKKVRSYGFMGKKIKHC